MSTLACAVRPYGKLVEIVPVDGETTLACPTHASEAELRRAIEGAFPALAGETYRIAVNGRLLNGEAVTLASDAEIALLPPFAGG